MRETGGESRRTRRRRAGSGLVAGTLCVALIACGGGSEERQDENEPAGKYPVEITTASFPTRQRLAQTSFLRLGVENTGRKALPALAVTISIAGQQGQNSELPFSIRSRQPGLAVPDRPVWILENDYPRLVGSSTTAGAQTANKKTFNFGALKPGDTTDAVWKVTPVQPGSYTLTYRVDAGLTGKAKAVTGDGGPPTGSFVVEITDVPPQTRVNDAGQVVEVPSQGGGGQGQQAGGSNQQGSSG